MDDRFITFYHTFRSWSHFLKKSQTWDKKTINSYQLKRIQCLLEHCLQHVPYYKQLFESNAIKLKNITSLADLGNIPLLTKDIIRDQQSNLKATNYPRNAFYQYHTGGTTGKPLYFNVEKVQWLGIHFAFNRHYMKKGGYHSYDKVISFCGIKTPVKYHPLYRTVELSSFYTTSSDFDQYNRIIHRFKPQFITAFPSALLLFTRDILNRKKNLYTNIHAIYCHGEVLNETQRTFLEETYNCRVFDQYGHREQCVYATTCPESNLYHVYPQYGIVEILDTQGQPIQSENKKGEIIATSLINNVFPFIRYKTDDFAETTSQTCPCMNHTLFIKRILGRTQEFP